ncbi:uncharacterized protein LOC141908105 [Tubulanus polymorphus]|uniref:uncharacterized protein LOC141908105 n=1 Tax=Tubulanus polymorphus TaxID=672921 RepID=UPI003DA1EA83
MVVTRRSCGKFEAISLSLTPSRAKKVQTNATAVKPETPSTKKNANSRDSTPTKKVNEDLELIQNSPSSRLTPLSSPKTPVYRKSNAPLRESLVEDVASCTPRNKDVNRKSNSKTGDVTVDDREIEDLVEGTLRDSDDEDNFHDEKQKLDSNTVVAFNEKKLSGLKDITEEAGQDDLGYFFDAKPSNSRPAENLEVLEYVIDVAPHLKPVNSQDDTPRDVDSDDDDDAERECVAEDDEIDNLGFFVDKTPAANENPIHYTSDEEESSDSSIVDESESDSEMNRAASLLDDLQPFTDSHSKTVTEEGNVKNSERKKKKAKKSSQASKWTLASSLQPRIKASSYIESGSAESRNITKLKCTNDDEILKKSIIKPGFDKLDTVPPYQESVRKLKKERREERSKTMGPKWFDMKAPEMTDELRDDLNVVKMRKSLNPKRFYKNNDTKALPKFFQMGEVVETAADFYHARIPKKQRKATVVEELLADAEFRKFNKRKFIEAQEHNNKFKRRKQVKKSKKK